MTIKQRLKKIEKQTHDLTEHALPILSLASGYSKPHFEGEKKFRIMRAGEAMRLIPGSRIPFLAPSGACLTLTINGEPKVWKTRPGHVRVPVKYGMYEFGYAESYTASQLDPLSDSGAILLVVTCSPIEASL